MNVHSSGGFDLLDAYVVIWTEDLAGHVQIPNLVIKAVLTGQQRMRSPSPVEFLWLTWYSFCLINRHINLGRHVLVGSSEAKMGTRSIY